MGELRRNMDTEEARAYWRFVDEKAGTCACGQPARKGFTTCPPCAEYHRERTAARTKD